MGKGSKPRNCFSSEFKNNYDSINWGRPKTNETEQQKETRNNARKLKSTVPQSSMLSSIQKEDKNN